MKISKIPGLGRFGVFIDDIDFDHLTDEQWMEIGRIHLDSLVTILRNVNLTKTDYPKWINKWGTTRFSLKSFLQKKYDRPFIQLVSDAHSGQGNLSDLDRESLKYAVKIFEDTSPGLGVQRVQAGYNHTGYPLGLFPSSELGWHSNEAGILSATPGVSLLGYANMVSSATSFVTTTDYYESVSQSWRSELDDMVVLHRPLASEVLGDTPTDDFALNIINLNTCWAEDTEVPLVVESPGGLVGLHFSPGSAHRIKGTTEQESKKIFDRLYRDVYQEKYMYDHWYQQDNDLLLFDNSITVHRRRGPTEGRIGYRIQFDYSHLQAGVYQPYGRHPKIARRYIKEINEIVRLQEITDFRLPGMWDYLKTFLPRS